MVEARPLDIYPNRIDINSMRYFALALLVISAMALTPANASLTYEGVQSYVETYNRQIESAPLLKGLIGTEKVNVNIAMDDKSTLSIGFETLNARVNRMAEGGLSEPSIIVWTNEGAINRIKDSSDPMTAFRSEVDSGQVRIEASNMITRFKISAALSSISVLKFFSSIFF